MLFVFFNMHDHMQGILLNIFELFHIRLYDYLVRFEKNVTCLIFTDSGLILFIVVEE